MNRGDRLLHQPFQGRDPDPVRERGHLGIDEPRRFGRQLQGELGDPAGPPHRQVTAHHPGPGLRQPVPGLDRVRDQRPPGVGGAPDGQGELGDAELRHQRRPRPGQGDPGVPTGHQPGRRLLDRLRRVLIGPEHRRGELVRLRPIRLHLTGPGIGQHVGGGVEIPGRGHCRAGHGTKSSTAH
jgi:hypothetical protein